MSGFTIHQANYEDGKLHEVLILCRDQPEPPMFFYEETVQPVEHVVSYLKNGHNVWAMWDGGCIPVEVVTLSNGEESIEVVQRGQPLGYRSLAKLPFHEDTFGV